MLLGLAVAVALASRPHPAGDRESGGEHFRLLTPHGPVHVWRPDTYDRRSAGTVVYVHGFAADADGAWEQHGLAHQFEASRRNAVFVVPEAPSSAEEPIRWPSLSDLLRSVSAGLGTALPRGPLVVVGHSAAHITLVPWLRNPKIDHVILLDAIYGDDFVRDLRAWLGRGSGRLTVVAADTVEDAEHLLNRLPSAVRAGPIPETSAGFTLGERRARVAYFRSQYSHLEIVTAGKVIPPLLSLTRLSPVAARPATRSSSSHPR